MKLKPRRRLPKLRLIVAVAVLCSLPLATAGLAVCFECFTASGVPNCYRVNGPGMGNDCQIKTILWFEFCSVTGSCAF